MRVDEDETEAMLRKSGKFRGGHGSKVKVQAFKRPTAPVVHEVQIPEFLSIAEACKLLGISRRTIYRMIKRIELRIGKAGKRTLIKRSEIDKLFT